jgi:site-specific DNA recombinase
MAVRLRFVPHTTHTSKHKLNYYRCLGLDGYRRLNGPLCTNRPIRQDYLDQFVWSEIIRLLDDSGLIQAEIDRRRETARTADPLRKREEELRREQVRVEKSGERLVTAYQEGLVTLPTCGKGCRHCGNRYRLSKRNYNR